MKTRKRYSRFSSLKLRPLSISVPEFSFNQIFGWSILAVYSVLFAIIMFSPLFKLSKTECLYFDNSTCPEAVKAEIARSFGQPALTFSSSGLQRKLKQAVPGVSEVEVTVKLPQTVKVHFIEQPALYQICHVSKAGCYAIDDSMNVTNFQSAPFDQLDAVLAPDITSLTVGATVRNTPFAPLHQLIILLMHNGIEHQEVEYQNPQLISVNLSGGRKALFDASQPLTRQVTSLQLILTKVTMEKPLPIIDVRFEKPVLKPAP